MTKRKPRPQMRNYLAPAEYKMVMYAIELVLARGTPIERVVEEFGVCRKFIKHHFPCHRRQEPV